MAYCSLSQRGQDNEFSGRGFLEQSIEIPSPENEGFWQRISASLTVFTGVRKKEN